MQHHHHEVPEGQLDLHLVEDPELGIYRVYSEGDRGMKPLFSGASKKEAERVFKETREALMKRAELVSNSPANP